MPGCLPDEYLVSKSVHASFEDIVPMILITNSDLLVCPKGLLNLSFLSQMLLPSWSPVKGLVSMPDNSPHFTVLKSRFHSNLPRVIPLFIFEPIHVTGTEIMYVACRWVPGRNGMWLCWMCWRMKCWIMELYVIGGSVLWKGQMYVRVIEGCSGCIDWTCSPSKSLWGS